MISKGLLSEVMGIHIAHCSECKADSDLFYTDIDGGHYINIYELAHKCKEWAYAMDKTCLMSTLYSKNTWVCSAQGDDPFTEANTEPEAIFKACQWILDNKN